MNFHSKEILLNDFNRICGKRIILNVSTFVDPIILLNLNNYDISQIFNKKNLSSFHEFNEKPWNVFYNVEIKNNEKIGFMWIVINHDLNLDITIHGGGWCKSLFSGLYYLDALISLAENLKKHFKVIRTSCKSNNIRARKLIEKSGFVFTEQVNNFNNFKYNF